MGAKSRLLFLLVASLIGIGFAFIPASKAEISHQIESVEHFDAKNLMAYLAIHLQTNLRDNLELCNSECKNVYFYH